MFTVVEDFDGVAMEMKLLAVNKPLDVTSAYSDTIAEAITNSFRPEVISEILKMNYNRAIIWKMKAFTLCLTVERNEKNDRIWHLSMASIEPGNIIPQQVPEEEAKTIFKAFFPNKEYQQSESKGALANVRHYHLSYEH